MRPSASWTPPSGSGVRTSAPSKESASRASPPRGPRPATTTRRSAKGVATKGPSDRHKGAGTGSPTPRTSRLARGRSLRPRRKSLDKGREG